MSISNANQTMPKKPAPQDWHKADIKHALHRTDRSLRSVAIAAGYDKPDTLNQALRHPYPKAERLIAAAIGVSPKDIWPSRYHADGTPKSFRGERGLGRYKPKCTVPGNGCKVNPETTS